MADFLQDRTFMLKVNRHKIRRYHAAILVLDFETEKPLARLEGKIVSGNINVAANSPTRRTASFNLLFDGQTYNITDINNLIAIDKKISLSVGLDNPFYHTPEYHQYGDVLWFKQGVFVITKASTSISTSALSVSISLSDKMAFLDGTCGGILPACVSFHEQITYDSQGNQTMEYPLIKDIIAEAVHHFGGEHVSKIVVSDVPTNGRIVVQYNGSSPIYFATIQDESGYGYELATGGSFIIGEPPARLKDKYLQRYIKGDNVGYKETPLTYPGELILKAGSKVTQVLDEIVSTLGNYEYFYDVDGVFHFQKKANFQSTGDAPLNLSVSEDNALQSLYTPRYSPSLLLNEFLDAELVTNISFNPNWSNIKNDFIYWGSKQESSSSSSSSSSNERLVRYHLAIDSRPEDVPKDRALPGVVSASLCHEDIVEVKSIDDDTLIRYQLGTAFNEGEKINENFLWSLDKCFPGQEDAWFNWREELYRRALLAYGSSTEGSYYDEELRAEWRKLFDPMSTFDRNGSESFQKRWEDKFGELNVSRPWAGYNVDVYSNPEKINYWLDIIDTTANIGKYSVSRIGRRTIVTEDSKINEVFAREVNDIIFVEVPANEKEYQKKMQEVREEYMPIGQTFTFLQQDDWNYFKEVNSYGTCYEGIRGQLYANLIYNSSVSLTTIPILYLDANQCIRLNFKDKGVAGDFIVNSIGFNFGTSPTMTLSLQEAMVVT